MSGIKKSIIGLALLTSITSEASTNNFKFFQKPSLVHSFNEMGSQTRLDALDDYAVVGVIQSGVSSAYDQNGAFYVFDPRTPQQSNTYQFIGAGSQYHYMKLGAQVAISQNRVAGLAMHDINPYTKPLQVLVVGKNSSNQWETCNTIGGAAQYDCHNFSASKNIQLVNLNHPDLSGSNRDSNNFRIALTDNLLAITSNATKALVVYKFNPSTKQWDFFYSKTYPDLYYVRTDNTLGPEKFSLAAYGDAQHPDRIVVGLPSYAGFNHGRMEVLTLNGTTFESYFILPDQHRHNHIGRDVDIYKSRIIYGMGKGDLYDAKPVSPMHYGVRVHEFNGTHWLNMARQMFFESSVHKVAIGRDFAAATFQASPTLSNFSTFTLNLGADPKNQPWNFIAELHGQLKYSSIYNAFVSKNEAWLNELTNPFAGLGEGEGLAMAGNNQLLLSYRQFPQKDSAGVARHIVGGVAITSASCTYTENLTKNDNSFFMDSYTVEILNYQRNTFSGNTYDDAECNMNTAFNFWKEGNGNYGKWQRHSGSTPSSNTGPSSGANGSNHYYYVETSSGGAYYAGDTAIIESLDLFTSNKTIDFDYHMYGSNIGLLELQYLYAGAWYTAASLSGNQGNTWKHYHFDLDSLGITENTKLRFKYTAAGGYLGDIALDNINISFKPYH